MSRIRSKGVFAPVPRPSATFRLFCLPYAGGSSTTFLDWPEHLDDRIEIVCIDPPGRAARFDEPAIAHVEVLVAQLADELREWLDRPFGLLGHSNGALVAFELARNLQREGTPPGILFGSAKPAPSRVCEQEILHTLPREDFIAALRAQVAIPEELFESEELTELFLPLLRADFALSENYRYTTGPILGCDLVLLAGSDDDCMSVADRAAWSQEFNGACSYHEIRGDHFFIEDNAEQVTALVAAEVMRMQQRRMEKAAQQTSAAMRAAG